MGSLSPLDNSSLPLEFSPLPSGVDQNQEYSFFSDHLSPLSQAPLQDPPPSPEKAYNSGANQEKEFKLFATDDTDEPLPKKRTKLFADKTTNPQTKQENVKASTESNKQKKAPQVQQKGNQATNIAHKAIVSNQSKQIATPEDSLVALKRNVKHILNNIPGATAAQKGASKSNVRTLPEGATLRIESAHDAQPAKAKTVKTAQQTTLAHVVARNKQNGINQPGTESTQQSVAEQQKKKLHTEHTDPSGRNRIALKNEIRNEAAFNPVLKQARTAKKGRTQQRSALNENQRQAIQKDANVPRFIPLDKIANTNTTQIGVNENVDAPQKLATKTTADADSASNQLGKGESKTSAHKSTNGKPIHIARSARATNWLKVLSERTSLLDKSNPQWKVLEMKLDKGNGSMTVRVMKEDDHVSVAVNFSDPEVKALAENQYNQILNDLKDQYQQEVKFTFNGQGQSAFESFSSMTPHKPKSHQLLQPIDKTNQDTPKPRSHNSPDNNVWIG